MFFHCKLARYLTRASVLQVSSQPCCQKISVAFNTNTRALLLFFLCIHCSRGFASMPFSFNPQAPIPDTTGQPAFSATSALSPSNRASQSAPATSSVTAAAPAGSSSSSSSAAVPITRVVQPLSRDMGSTSQFRPTRSAPIAIASSRRRGTENRSTSRQEGQSLCPTLERNIGLFEDSFDEFVKSDAVMQGRNGQAPKTLANGALDHSALYFQLYWERKNSDMYVGSPPNARPERDQLRRENEDWMLAHLPGSASDRNRRH